MRILHTSDWHVGRAVRGKSRDDEHKAVLSEISGIVKDEGVELVLIAGDIFDHQTPTASAEEIVYEALLNLVQTGAHVVMIAGNHDHPNRLQAVRPLLKFANIDVGAQFMPPNEGGCLNLQLPSGETAAIALMPWFSRSKIVSVDDLMTQHQDEHQQKYKERYKRILDYMCSGFTPQTVNLVLAHLVVTGAMMGGGERTSETIEDYWVDPPDLNVAAQYVALGHIHKPQGLNLMWPAYYSGSPMQLDFGEEKDEKSVLVFEAQPGVPVKTPRIIPLKSGRRMMTVHGTLESLGRRAPEFGDAYLRVYVTDPPRAGLADEVRELLPNAVEVKVDAPPVEGSALVSRQGMQPRDLLNSYFEQANIHDEAALRLFDELVEEDRRAAPAP